MLKLENGLRLNADHEGFLSLSEERVKTLVHQTSISEKYDVEQVPFARGKFATVRRCVDKQSHVAYAAKFIRKRRRAMDQRHEIIHEMAVLLAGAGCERIVGLHEAYETPSEIALVLHLAEGGELQRVIDENDHLEEGEVVRLMRQILEGIVYLHDRNIAHLDIKPQNLLLTGSFPGCNVKLCDYGIARVLRSGVEVREIMGTPDYVAPEVLSYEPISLATDIWSIGILTYVLLSGHSPFAGETKQETFCNISQGNLDFPEDLFSNVSDAAKCFVKATLVLKPGERPTAKECMAHPWLSSAPLPQPLVLCDNQKDYNSDKENQLASPENGIRQKRRKNQVSELISSMESEIVC